MFYKVGFVQRNYAVRVTGYFVRNMEINDKLIEIGYIVRFREINYKAKFTEIVY